MSAKSIINESDPSIPQESRKIRVTLKVDEEGKDTQEVELPVSFGHDGKPFIDVSGLNRSVQMFTYDPGFVSTASCSSSITFIDGPQGKLFYRGYSIEDLARNSTFQEVTFLLLHGHLPLQSEMDQFKKNMARHSLVHEKLRSFYQGFRVDAHPMSIMCGVMGAMSSFFHESFDIYDVKKREQHAYRVIAKMPTIAAMAYKYSVGHPFVYPRFDLPYAENFLRMMFSVPSEEYKVDPVIARAMDTVFLLHADHGQNASTSTARIAASSHANPFACIAAAIASLWGPAHGGANEAVLRMLNEIKTRDRIPLFLARAKDKSDPFRLFGFGHRVYKSVDPRAKIMKEVCKQVLERTGTEHDEILALAVDLENAASQDEYFISRGLYANVDFYSGIVFRAIGIPESMFTVIFAVGRSIGWVSNWLEMMRDPKMTKIARPRQRYEGEIGKEYVPIEKRSDDNNVEPESSARGDPVLRRKLSVI